MREHAHHNALFCLGEIIVSELILKKGKEQVQTKTVQCPCCFYPYYTNSIITIGAPSPRRGPSFMIRVYPPWRSS